MFNSGLPEIFDAEHFRNRRHVDGDCRTIGRWTASVRLCGQGCGREPAGVNAGIGEQRRQYEQTRTDLAPYRDVGTGALYQLRDMTKPGGYLMSDYTGASLESDPGYSSGSIRGSAPSISRPPRAASCSAGRRSRT